VHVNPHESSSSGDAYYNRARIAGKRSHAHRNPRGASDLGSADEAGIDSWAREKIDQMCQLTEASWATVRELTKTI